MTKFDRKSVVMKKLIYNLKGIAFLAAAMYCFGSCKDARTEADDASITTESTETTVTTGQSDSDANNVTGSVDGSAEMGSGTNGDGSMSGSTPESVRTGSGNRVPSDGYSGDGSDGRTSSTAVNTSKNVQMGTNKKPKSLKGYSAPDGTRAENHDGDMYTKHDTTMMPSGSTPIK